MPVPYPVSLLLAGFGHLLRSLLCSSSSSIQKAVTEPLPGVRCWIKHLQSVSKTHSLYMTSSTLNQMIGKLSCFSLERVQHSVFLNDHEQVLFPQQLHGQGVMEGIGGVETWRCVHCLISGHGGSHWDLEVSSWCHCLQENHIFLVL